MNHLKQLFFVLVTAVVLTACGSTDIVEDSTTNADQSIGADTMGTGSDDGFDSNSGMNNDGGLDSGLPTVFYFDYDRSTLTYETRQSLDRHAENLRNSARVIRLEGHGDDRGTREYNLALGERRAKSIADYLVLQGVSRSQLETISYGEEKPVAFTHDEESYRMNRRVELK
ncbi:MAG: peptidoglycan-associated lipoprotein Pal [Pseudomonadales bacterium]